MVSFYFVIVTHSSEILILCYRIFDSKSGSSVLYGGLLIEKWNFVDMSALGLNLM